MVGQRLGPGRVQDDRPVGQARHVGDALVVGVQHRHTVGQHHIDLGAHHPRHLLGLADVVALELLEAVQVGDHADMAAVVGQAGVENDAGVVLDHHRLDLAVHQQAVAAVPVGAVATADASAGQEQAVAAGQADMATAQMHQPRDDLRDLRGLARAGHADHRHAAAGVLGEQVIDDRLADRARHALRGLEVHQQAGAGVDLDDRAAGLVQRARDVGGDQIDAGDVQADDARGQAHLVGDIRMHVVGAVDRDVAVALDQHLAAGFGHRAGVQALALEQQPDHRLALQADRLEREFLGLAAARVGVELGVDQLLHAGAAVAGDPQRLAARGGDHLAGDDQHAVLVAGNVALDDDLAALGVGDVPGGHDLLAGAQVQAHAAAVVGVAGLDHHRHADVLGLVPGGLGAVRHRAFGHRHAAGLQQRLGHVLVAGDAFGDRAGQVGLGGPDAALRRAVAELHQIAVVEPDVRNAAIGGRADDAGGAGAQIAVVDLLAHPLDRRRHLEGLVVDRAHQQPVAFGQRGAGDLLVAGAEDHAVDAVPRGAAGLAEAGGHARQVQQLDDHMLEHMAHPGAFLQALQEAAALAHAAVVLDQRRQHRGQPVVEAGQPVRRPVLEFAQIQPDFERRTVGPHIGAAQVGDAQQLDVVFLAHVVPKVAAEGPMGT